MVADEKTRGMGGPSTFGLRAIGLRARFSEMEKGGNICRNADSPARGIGLVVEGSLPRGDGSHM